MDNYKETIISSAPISEITTFLKTTTNKQTEQTFYCDDCEVIIDRTWVEQVGSLHLQRTKITFKGRRDTVSCYVKMFRLRFLSAGG